MNSRAKPHIFKMQIVLSFFLTISFVAALPLTTSATDSGEQTDEGITILLMGVDKATGEEFDVGVRPDSLMVLHLDPSNGSCRILGIPRDTRVNIPGIGFTKINHALSEGGVSLQVDVVEGFLGLEIDHYGMVAYDGLIGVVDSVGGITVDNPYAFEHEGTFFAAGEIPLNGEDALTYSRYRYGPDGDFGRIGRQQLVIRALLKEFSTANPIQIVPQTFNAIDGYFRTDLTLPMLMRLASQFQASCTTDTLETRTIVGENAMYHDPLLNLDLWYVVVDEATVTRDIQWLLTGNG